MCRWASDLPEVKRQLVEERKAQADEDFKDIQGEGETKPQACLLYTSRCV